MKPTLLLVNLGTPDAPDVPSVRRYLRQFLMDPFVIDVPSWLRAVIVKGFILPTRPKKSARAYQSIWTKEGSPLLVNSQAFEAALRKELGEESPFSAVELGMRYGNPSIESVLQKIADRKVRDVIVWPLYPQFADSSTTTALTEVAIYAKKLGLNVRDIPAFYDDPRFAEALGYVTDQEYVRLNPDHVLMSFHGLPKRHVKRLSAEPCVTGLPSCCDQIGDYNKNCYRAQSMATARKLAHYMNLRSDQWSVSFQSRLGTGWIEPFTDVEVPKLAARGIKNLAVVCPSFTMDCLETLEEIGIRAHEQFLSAGGSRFSLIPCLNANPFWIERAAEIARDFANAST